MLKSILKYTRVSSNQELRIYEYRCVFIDNSLSYSYFNYIRGVKNCQLFDKNYTTIAKGIAILLIMVCHCFGHWTENNYLLSCFI